MLVGVGVGVGIASWRTVRRDHAVFLGVAGLLNVIAVAIGTGLSPIHGFTSVLAQGGFLLLTMIVLAVFAALGTTSVIGWISSRAPAGAGAGAETCQHWLSVGAAVLIAAVVIGPSVAVHRAHADLRVPDFADAYGKQVLAALPPHAVLLVGTRSTRCR